MIYLDIPYQRKHSLNYLLGLISTKIEITDEVYDNASILEDFAVEIRYPDTTIDLSDEDIQQAFEISKMFRKYVLSLMNITIDYKDVKKE